MFRGELKEKDCGPEDSDAENLCGQTSKYIYVDIYIEKTFEMDSKCWT